jgi:hypothetical protein
MWKTEKFATPKKPRSRKARLPPRVPTVCRIPRLDGINFATPEVLATLDITEMSYSDISDPPDPPKISLELNISDQNLNLDYWAVSDAALFKENALKLDINNGIQEIMAIYWAACEQQLPPKLFRPGLKKFQKRLDALIEDFKPDAGANAQGPWLPRARHKITLRSTLSEALDRELERQHGEEGMISGLQAVEKGRGPDGDRPKHELIDGLGKIFEERTRLKPRRSHNSSQEGDDAVTGKFAAFVKAVNKSIPRPYKITGLDNLIRAMV